MRLVGDTFVRPHRAFSVQLLRTGVPVVISLFLLTDNRLRGQTSMNPGTGSPANSATDTGASTALAGNLSDTNIVEDFNLPSNPPPTSSSAAPTNQSGSNPSPGTDSGGSGGSIDTNSASARLAMATYFASMVQPEKAEPILVSLLAGNMPESIQKSALFELATVVAEENDLPRAQSIYDQYLVRWPSDIKIPEILLRQGELFRRMGLNDLALGKFYSVMTSALSLKGDQLEYYRNLVLQTQVEIAETHYLAGQFADAADFYSRLMLNTDPALNHSQIQFRLVRSLAVIHRYDQAVGQAKDFVIRYPDADQEPEVRYYLAQGLKALGQTTEALQEVLLCLREQKGKTHNNPQVWAYWQQRVGNEIANQLYHEGDFINSLLIYQGLAQLDSSPDWQVPVDYQMGVTYEKLSQPQKAVETYNAILARETDQGTNTSSALQAVFDMARWRLKFVQWQTNAEAADHAIMRTVVPALAIATNLQTSISQ
jgi:tetratricopeptide (TPR) repeat protein